ncbi:disease resistance protein RPV1-like [Telopea speciosissima]|uniref:disease resistance protein RPV1-like n=1 Tax=Telopea speciosissima TaxID=54955 RepID=UPI001CC4D96E|nr:disease resistance protein RPV1-like [Telopea speciosissima]
MEADTEIPSSSSSGWKYDVFLSYEREETENINFASKLCAFLEKTNLKTLKDDEPMKAGEHISPMLMQRIKESRCAIIIFSRNYASSIGCLEELTLTMECRKKLGQKVFPVFLMGVKPSEVRHQKGSFEEPFRFYQEHFEPEVVEGWRSALRAAGEISGWNMNDLPHGDEEKLIAKMVKEVSNLLLDDGLVAERWEQFWQGVISSLLICRDLMPAVISDGP